MSGRISSIHATVSGSSHGPSELRTSARRAGSRVGILDGRVKSRPNQLKIGDITTRPFEGSRRTAPLARNARIWSSSSVSMSAVYGDDRSVGHDIAPHTSAAWILGSRKRRTLPCSIRSSESGSSAISTTGAVKAPGTPSIESAPPRAASAASRNPAALYTLIQNARASDRVRRSGSIAAACFRYRSNSPAWSGNPTIGLPPAMAASTAASREWSNDPVPFGCGARTRTSAVTMDHPARSTLGEVSVMLRATSEPRFGRRLCRTADSRTRS